MSPLSSKSLPVPEHSQNLAGPFCVTCGLKFKDALPSIIVLTIKLTVEWGLGKRKFQLLLKYLLIGSLRRFFGTQGMDTSTPVTTPTS
jgi:hypothetical protein